MERAVLHENGHDRAAALVETRFHDRAARRTVRVGLELHDLGLQHEIFQKLLDARAGLRGDRADDRIAAPLFGDEIVFGEILLDAVGVRAGEIHLVDRHDDRRTGGLGVVDGLDRLRHDAVIGRNDENGDIGHHRAAGAHGGKGLVARRIEEGDGAAVDHHAVRADVLRNAARLARNDVRAADAVEQGGLAVVDVAHDDDDRRAGDEFVLGIDVIVNKTVLDRHNDLVLHLAAKLHGDERGGIVIDHIGHGRHHAELDELLDDLDRRFLHAGGELADVDLVGDADLELLFLRDLKLQALHLVALFLAALGACDLLLALLVLVLDLLLAAAADVLVLPGVAGVTGDLVEALVVFREIRSGGAAGIDDALFHDLLRLGGLLRLRLLRLLYGRGSGCCGRRRAAGGLFLRGSVGFLLFRRLGGGLLLLRFGGEDLGNAADLVMLRQILKNEIQLGVLENLHMVLRRRGIVGEDLGNILGGHAKILGNLVNAVFKIKRHTYFLLFPLSVCLRGAAFRRLSLSSRWARSSAVSFQPGSSSASAAANRAARGRSVKQSMLHPRLPIMAESSAFVQGSVCSGAR